MSQKAKKVTTGPHSGEEVLARCNMSGQKGRRVKLDASHLLNFTTDTSRHHGQYGANTRARKSSAYTRGYTKEHYLLSNAQFVVDQGLDWEGYLSDPDQMLPWDLIQQVRLISNSPPSCPICLSLPEAARVTKCGHIYCLPCLLHLFSLAEGRWDACPVCGEMIKLSDAKPVESLQKRSCRSGDTVCFVKVARPAELNYPLPCYLERGERQLLASCDKGAQFSKLLTGDKEFRNQLLTRDRRELCRAMKDSLADTVFVQNALDLIESELGETQKVNTAKLDAPADSASNICVDQSQDELLDQLNYSEEFAEIDTSAEIPLSSKHNLEDLVYHYQLSDGQYIFLDPLNTAMLREEYRVLARSPDRIRGRVVSITHHVVSEPLRHKYKWLSHLPLMCELQFFEVNLKPPLISHQVLDMFKETVEKRRINRQIKQKQEDISEKKAAAYWSKTYPSLLCEASDEEVPDLSAESFTPLPSTSNSCVPITEPVTAVPLASSFAHALSHQHQHVPSKPSPDPLSVPVPVPEASAAPAEKLPRTSSESDDEFAPPTYSESMSDAIATKLDAYLLQRDIEAVPKSKIPCGPSRGKRGKGKKILLFSTSAGRPN